MIINFIYFIEKCTIGILTWKKLYNVYLQKHRDYFASEQSIWRNIQKDVNLLE